MTAGAPFDLNRSVFYEMTREMLFHQPLEMCGLVFGAGPAQVFYAVKNVARTPMDRFEMHPGGLLERMQWAEDHHLRLEAVFHSHCTGPRPPVPSEADELAARSYPLAVQLIGRTGRLAGEETVSAFRLAQDGLVPVPLRVPDATGRTGAERYLSV